MKITAKFASTCPSCGAQITPGTTVEWERGSKAVHVKCPARTASPAKTAVATAVATTVAAPSSADSSANSGAPFTLHERWEPCKRAYLPNACGETRRQTNASRVATTGATHPAHGVYVVVSQDGRYESTEDNEDMGDMSGPSWHMVLKCRAATDAEAAPVLAAHAAKEQRIAAKQERERLIKELRKLCETGGYVGDEPRCPEGETVILQPGVSGNSGLLRAVLISDTSVGVWCYGYYDDYRSSLCVSNSPRAVEIMRSLLQQNQPVSQAASA